MAKICIVGYGYVGRSQAALLAGREHSVEAYDPPFVDDWNERYRTFGATSAGATGCRVWSSDTVVEQCDLAIVCVPSPAREDGSCDTSIVEAAVSHVIEKNQCGCLILIRSTVPPGTTSRLSFTHGHGASLEPTDRLHFSPEFVVERTGDEARDRMIVGGPRAAEVLSYFDRALPAEARRVVCSATEAEMVKYMTNAFLAVKVAFATEMSDIGRALGLDYAQLRELWLLDDRVGRSHTMVYGDRRGFGGKCLPKDVLALEALARERGVSAPLLSGALMYSQGPGAPNGT